MVPSEVQIREILSGPVQKTGHHLICTCWNCNKELHYYFNLSNGLSDCKKCSRGWNLYQFLQGWNALHLLEGNQVDISHVKPLHPLGEAEPKEELILREARLPLGFTKLRWDDGSIYTKYLRKRKYTREDFALYQPGYTELLHRYEGCVIIPVYRNWTVTAFVARSIFSKQYMNEKNAPFHRLLDGIDECTVNTKVGIIVEGHFDKISVTTELGLHTREDFRGLSSFGKKLSKEQINLICSTNITDLYFLYDMRDAIRQIKMFGNLLKHRMRVYGCWQATTKDAGEMSRQELLTMLHTAQPIEAFTYNVLQANALR